MPARVGCVIRCDFLTLLGCCSLSSPEHERADARGASPATAQHARDLFKLLVPQLKCDLSDMRESVIMALGHVNPYALRELLDELVPLVKEAIERKKGNKERIRRRDTLRLALARILHYMASNGVFSKW